jgi:hypothetical protein
LAADADDDERRTVTLTARGPSWLKRWKELDEALTPWRVAS